MSGMPGMPGMLPALSWSTFFGTWHLSPGWLVAAVVLVGGYLLARSRAPHSSVPSWRVGSFVLGCVLMWACIASGVGAYAMSVFWMHMVLHLLLIMVVPALLVLGHPVTVLVEAFPERGPAVARSLPVTVLTSPVTGLALYTGVIVGTHLTGFMDRMTEHSWLMSGEQVLYVVTGYLFLLPLIGEEPIRANPSYLMRLVLFLVAMVPDTLVGIALLQSDSDPFPVMFGQHPDWAPSPISDIHVAGGLMWAGGDGLMMLMAVGLAIAMVTSPERQARATGAWLDSARRATMAGRTGLAEDADPDSEEAREAYNRMLARMRGEGER